QALVVIGHFKPAWHELSAEEQAAFVAQVGRTARKIGVRPIVGYRLSTRDSFLEVWESDSKEILQAFIGELDGLEYKKYYDEVLMLGERSENWIAPEAPAAANPGTGSSGQRKAGGKGARPVERTGEGAPAAKQVQGPKRKR
ncbi:MAG: hypothetical protein ACM3JD_04855, partial [Rudaea sp.]